jgi:hypothetical protein
MLASVPQRRGVVYVESARVFLARGAFVMNQEIGKAPRRLRTLRAPENVHSDTCTCHRLRLLVVVCWAERRQKG